MLRSPAFRLSRVGGVRHILWSSQNKHFLPAPRLHKEQDWEERQQNRLFTPTTSLSTELTLADYICTTCRYMYITTHCHLINLEQNHNSCELTDSHLHPLPVNLWYISTGTAPDVYSPLGVERSACHIERWHKQVPLHSDKQTPFKRRRWERKCSHDYWPW